MCVHLIAKLLVLHFIADFVLQSREMGKKKSSQLRFLAMHLLIQYAVFSWINWKFALANALIHGVIDWNIWKLYKVSAHARILRGMKKEGLGSSMPFSNREELNLRASKWQYWEDHLFYTTIGFDQLLHVLTLVYLAGTFHL